MPVFRPGPTISGSRANAWRRASAMTSVSGGTTLAMIAASIQSGSCPCSSNIWCSSTPYSSAVRVRTVDERKVFLSVAPSYNPKTTLVLPMSTARSTGRA